MNREDQIRTETITKILNALGADQQYHGSDPACGINLDTDSTIRVTCKMGEVVGNNTNQYYYETCIYVTIERSKINQERTP